MGKLNYHPTLKIMLYFANLYFLPKQFIIGIFIIIPVQVFTYIQL